VGPEGRVYSFVPAEVAHFKNDPVGRMRTLAKEPGRENVEAVSADLVAMPEATQPADVLWLHLFYHDLYTALIQARGATAAHFNRAAYERLKPGGSYVIVDHAAAVGAGTSDAQSLHRIEPASVREEVEAAGFVLDAESTMQGRSALDQGVRSLDQGRDRSLRLPVREALTGPGADFMSTSPWVQTSPSKTSRQPCLPPRSRLWMSSSGGPTRRWQRRPLKRHFGVLLEELDGLPSSAFVAKAFTGAKLVKGFNHLVAATLAADPIVEGGHRVVFLSSDDEDATAPVAALAKQLGFAPVKLGKLNEGGALVHARGRTWGQLIFQDLFKKEQ
jgi:hypothetical protein